MSIKISTNDFIKKAKEKYGDLYNYSKVVYVNTSAKITIICSKHGEFEQTPNNFLNNHCCQKCGLERKIEKASSTTEIFIKKAKEIHEDKYDYSLVNYINNYNKIKIICSKHGEFEQTPNHHLSGDGCPKCRGYYKTTKEFINEAKKIHGNKYDYSLTNYINNKTKIKITCPIHGVYEQLPASHLSGQNCPKCVGRNVTTEEFIEKARKVHGDKYNYSKSIYVNDSTNVKIICPKHGEFEQIPNCHLSKHGCPKCGLEKTIQNLSSTTKEFIERASLIHNNKYDYSLTEYINSHTKVKIICPKHGIFEQQPCDHLNGCGCFKCKESKGEKNIRNFLEKNNIEYIKEKGFDECKNKAKLLFDFYLPQNNILIEYDGIQHHEPINFFGGIESFNYLKQNDNIKTNFAEDNNIQLIRISYKENVEEKLLFLQKS